MFYFSLRQFTAKEECAQLPYIHMYIHASQLYRVAFETVAL